MKFHNTVLQIPFSLSLLFLLVLSNNVFFKKEKVEKKNPTNNKLQTGLIEEVAIFHSNAGDEWKKALTASLHVVTADWHGSDSSWLICQVKIN